MAIEKYIAAAALALYVIFRNGDNNTLSLYAIAPESDIAVFNMLGYKFRHAGKRGPRRHRGNWNWD